MVKLLNLAGYYAIWFACVQAAAHGVPELGAFVALILLAVHLRFAAHPGEHILLLAAAGMGYVLDGYLVRAGLLEFSGSSLVLRSVPLWMALLWASFAATLGHSLVWLRERYLLSVWLGVLGGPLAYFSGQALGALTLAPGAWTWIALEWAFAVPLLVWLARRARSEQPLLLGVRS